MSQSATKKAEWIKKIMSADTY